MSLHQIKSFITFAVLQQSLKRVGGAHLPRRHGNQVTFEEMFRQLVITKKSVTGWRSPSTRHCAKATQLLLKKCRSGREPLAALPDFTGPRFKPKKPCFIDECIIARPIVRLCLVLIYYF